MLPTWRLEAGKQLLANLWRALVIADSLQAPEQCMLSLADLDTAVVALLSNLY